MALPAPAPDAITQSILWLHSSDAITLLLARHGQPGPAVRPDASHHASHGHPLTPLGHRQARRLGQRLSKLPLDHLYCSPLARSHQTALAVHAHHPTIPLEVRDDIVEVGVLHNAYTPAPRRKALLEQMEQERATAMKFVRHFRKAHQPGQIVAAVLHGNLNNLLMSLFLELPARTFYSKQNHTCVNVLTIPPRGKAYLGLINCTRHLPASMIGTGNIMAAV